MPFFSETGELCLLYLSGRMLSVQRKAAHHHKAEMDRKMQAAVSEDAAKRRISRRKMSTTHHLAQGLEVGACKEQALVD